MATSTPVVTLKGRRMADFLVYQAGGTESRALVEALLPDPDRLIVAEQVFPGRGRSCTTARVVVNGQDYVLKKYEYRGLWYGLRHIFKRSRALRVFLNQQIACAAGVAVPEPLLCLEERRLRFLRRCYVLGRYLPDSRTLDEAWDDLSPAARDALLATCGGYFQTLHRSGIVHGDSNWRNILLTDEGGRLTAHLIDFDNSLKPLLHCARKFRKDIGHFLRDMHHRQLPAATIEKFLAAWRGPAVPGAGD